MISTFSFYKSYDKKQHSVDVSLCRLLYAEAIRLVRRYMHAIVMCETCYIYCFLATAGPFKHSSLSVGQRNQNSNFVTSKRGVLQRASNHAGFDQHRGISPLDYQRAMGQIICKQIEM